MATHKAVSDTLRISGASLMRCVPGSKAVQHVGSRPACKALAAHRRGSDDCLPLRPATGEPHASPARVFAFVVAGGLLGAAAGDQRSGPSVVSHRRDGADNTWAGTLI